MRPKSGLVTSVVWFRASKNGVLNRLKNSARNCRLSHSFALGFLNKDMSKLLRPGPRRSGCDRESVGTVYGAAALKERLLLTLCRATSDTAARNLWRAK